MRRAITAGIFARYCTANQLGKTRTPPPPANNEPDTSARNVCVGYEGVFGGAAAAAADAAVLQLCWRKAGEGGDGG